MMKGFETYGKWLGAVLLALGLVFAGCAGGSGSDEGEVSPAASADGIPVYVDIPDSGDPVVNFGNPDGEAAVVVVNGHSLELSNSEVYNANSVATTVDGPGGDGKVWVRVINRDSDEYMANVYLYAHGCSTCSTAQLDSAQMQGSSVVAATPCVNGCSSPVDIPQTNGMGDGAGMCIVEDGQYDTIPFPYNEMGCKTHLITYNQPGGQKPFQVLHPDCGTMAKVWDFGGQSGQYKFFAALQAEYFPWEPRNDGGAQLDGRMDFYNYTTAYLMICDLADNLDGVLGANADWYNIGSYVRSNTLAGWGSGGGKANLAKGQFFALNVAIEYPDRVEERVVGNHEAFTNYEYFKAWAVTLRFNPAVIYHTDSGKINTGITVLAGGWGQVDIENQGGWSKSEDRWKGGGSLLQNVTHDVTASSQGWISLGDQWSGSTQWTYMSATYYETVMGGRGWVPIAYGPGNMGHTGIAHIRVSPYPAYFSAGAAYPMSAWIVQEGPDIDPDFNLHMLYFQVQNTAEATGAGSEFWVDTHAAATTYILRWTNNTTFPTHSADDFTHCWPPPVSASPCPAIPLYQNGINELTNPAISHTCKDCPAYLDGGGVKQQGSYQQWPVHICVQ
jgi:hypothetical protein